MSSMSRMDSTSSFTIFAGASSGRLSNIIVFVSIHITPSPPGGLTHFGRNPLESIDTTITPMKSLSSSICVASRSHSVVSRQLPCLASQHLSVRVEWAAGLEIFTAPKLKIRLSGEPHIQW